MFPGDRAPQINASSLRGGYSGLLQELGRMCVCCCGVRPLDVGLVSCARVGMAAKLLMVLAFLVLVQRSRAALRSKVIKLRVSRVVECSGPVILFA